MLNRQAVSERLRGLELKQWWVARQVGVTKLTVNRWLTGRIRRVSRENLARLAQVLRCDEDQLAMLDDGELCASQAEQSAAAQRLVRRDVQLLFMKTDQLELYESLLKALAHPNLPLENLVDVYSSLTFASAQQGKLEEVQQYARLYLEYAIRSGDVDRELAARTNLVTALGESGQLSEAIRGLSELVSTAESTGNHRSLAISQLNLVYALRLKGEMREAIRTANSCLSFFATSKMHWGAMHALSNAALIALECGQFEQSASLRREAMRRTEGDHGEAEIVTTEMFELLAASLKGHLPDLRRLEDVVPRFIAEKRRLEGGLVWPSVVYRRTGQLEQAARLLQAAMDNGPLRVYEPPFAAEEQARLAWAMGDRRKARRLRDKANRLFAGLDMIKRCSDDPASELGSQFEAPKRLRIVYPMAQAS